MSTRKTTRALKTLKPVRWDRVKINDGFWGQRVTTNRKVTLPIEYEQCKKTGRIDAFKLDWKAGMPHCPDRFWDSDVAKWVEAAAYSLATHPDKQLQKKLDNVIDLIASAQQEDGYLNTHFTTVRPQDRWKNLRDDHELYCAGHLMEAAVAVYEGLGDRKLLDVMCRYADYIETVFGPQKHKLKGYPGHEEIELALVKLYQATNNEKYLKLSQFFIDQRGQQPLYFVEEAKVHGRHHPWFKEDYHQSHLPVRKQKSAVGHSVRALYLYSGMADVAAQTGDRTLLNATRRLWDNLVTKRMYITGGVGSTAMGERFTFDYDLPNETAYAETCAAISLVFFAHRMSQIECKGEYGDVLEKALFNGVLSGINLKGDRFFYANPLRSSPSLMQAYQPGHVSGQRQAWFGCACCPPNIARLFASLGQYIFACGDDELVVHQFINATTQVIMHDVDVKVKLQTTYPWDETVELKVDPAKSVKFKLRLRVPGWCRKATLKVNGKVQRIGSKLANGYVTLERKWEKGDVITLVLAMPVERMHTHPACRVNQGKVALQRGPLVYCVEEVDCGFDPMSLVLPRGGKLAVEHRPRLLGGATVITGSALRHDPGAWQDGLYATTEPKLSRTTFTAVPYCLWGNRKVGSMTVWVNQG
ncbi:MAG: hypothetical protein CMJ19_15000 [Phycisphaeraceae bacterium]|nr:hypothetical protein [Phycisphaeraceae bacterium]